MSNSIEKCITANPIAKIEMHELYTMETSKVTIFIKWPPD